MNRFHQSCNKLTGDGAKHPRVTWLCCLPHFFFYLYIWINGIISASTNDMFFFSVSQNVSPNPRTSCGPYKPSAEVKRQHPHHQNQPRLDIHSHDTIGTVTYCSKAPWEDPPEIIQQEQCSVAVEHFFGSSLAWEQR